ncbi:hypothetical protein HNR05_002843 [Leifsonia psychrotolerans]|uniref:Uncharacterized protein n=2 Tax=Glaciibacter psychrotolerans TaxID=670054 RepID=A0A7Z0J6Z0_9MICO|nr:hypothetical protein [Leifsonia psychrotolerans]NYJ21052.1 hypothetical protein [Leifsonia psychrotolerans]
MRYESAFVATRAELDAAIGEAALAERATTQAKQDYFEAVQKVALAEPGTPGAILRPYYDPGAQRLAQAQLAVDALRTRLAQTGDEVAAEVQAAANTTSGKSSEISVWDQIVMFPGTLVEGFILQGVDTAVGVWDLTPGPYIWDELFNGGDSWTDSFGEVWPGIIDSIVNDPGGAALEMWNGFIAADHWDGYTGGGVGRVLFNGASLFVGGGGVLRGLKSLKGLSAAAKLRAMTKLLSSSTGVTVKNGKVKINGVDKMTVDELADIYNDTLHNMDADQATLGKFVPKGPASYEQIAGKAGDAHFSLDPSKWAETQKKFDLTNNEMYELLNKPFLNEIIEKKLPVRFTHDPNAQKGTSLYKELQYLRLNGYEYDPATRFATFEGN